MQEAPWSSVRGARWRVAGLQIWRPPLARRMRRPSQEASTLRSSALAAVQPVVRATGRRSPVRWSRASILLSSVVLSPLVRSGSEGWRRWWARRNLASEAAAPGTADGAAPEEGLRRQTRQDLPDNEILGEEGAAAGRFCHDSGHYWILEK
jgi:hypothetical protein